MLRGGGYPLYFRHATADLSQQDIQGKDFAEGEAAIVKPVGDGFEVVAQVEIGEWRRLAQK